MPYAVLLAGWLFMQAAPGPGSPIVTPPDIHVTNTTQLVVPARDQQAVSDDASVAYQSLIVNIAQPVPTSWVDSLCSLPDVWRTTPPNLTYDHPNIVSLANKVEAAAIGLLSLAILAQGLGHTLGQELTLGRVVLGLVLSIGNLTWWTIGVGLNNALSDAIAAPDLCASLIKPHIAIQAGESATTGSQVAAAIGGPVLVIVYALVSLLLLISLLFRLGLLDVLIAAGSLALMCFASEQSEHIGQWYVRLSIGSLFGQLLLVIGLQVAGVLSGLGNGLSGTLLTLVVLLLCRSLLGTLSSQSVQRGESSMGIGMALLIRRLIAKV